MKWLLQHFCSCNDSCAVLSWYVQFVVIWWTGMELHLNEITIECEFRVKDNLWNSPLTWFRPCGMKKGLTGLFLNINTDPIDMYELSCHGSAEWHLLLSQLVNITVTWHEFYGMRNILLVISQHCNITISIMGSVSWLDDLLTQRAKASAALMIASFTRNIPVSIQGKFSIIFTFRTHFMLELHV